MENFGKPIIIVYNDQRFSAHPIFNKVSDTLRTMPSFADDDKPEREIPIYNHEITADDINFMNRFIEVCQEKFGEDLLSNANKLSYWMENIPKRKDELLPVATDIDGEVLIRSANLADFLIIYPLLVFSIFALNERCENMKLDDMRAFLNEEDDLDDEQKKIIESCLELKDL